MNARYLYQTEIEAGFTVKENCCNQYAELSSVTLTNQDARLDGRTHGRTHTGMDIPKT